METKRTLILNIRKRQLKILGHIMRKEGLENLILTGHTEGKRDSGIQRITCLTSLCKWLAEQRLGKIVNRQNLQKTGNYREPEWTNS